MIPNAHRMFNFDLGETADAIRETVHDFSAHEIAPRAAEIVHALRSLAGSTGRDRGQRLSGRRRGRNRRGNRRRCASRERSRAGYTGLSAGLCWCRGRRRRCSGRCCASGRSGRRC